MQHIVEVCCRHRSPCLLLARCAAWQL